MKYTSRKNPMASKTAAFVATTLAVLSPFAAKAEDSPLKNPKLDTCAATALKSEMPGGIVQKRNKGWSALEYSVVGSLPQPGETFNCPRGVIDGCTTNATPAQIQAENSEIRLDVSKDGKVEVRDLRAMSSADGDTDGKTPITTYPKNSGATPAVRIVQKLQACLKM